MLAANAGYRTKTFDLRERALEETFEQFQLTGTMESLIPLDR
jgi:hypothetical protein